MQGVWMSTSLEHFVMFIPSSRCLHPQIEALSGGPGKVWWREKGERVVCRISASRRPRLQVACV